MSFRRLVTGEAFAYLRSGLLHTTRARVRKNTTQVSDVGVLFVHGLGANETQFRSLRRALADDVQWFDAFNYNSLANLDRVARDLRAHVIEAGTRVRRLIIVGHSLGGVVSRMVLQGDTPPDHVAAFIAICSPLHGTRLSRFAPAPNLRALKPDSPLMHRLHVTRDRLDRLDVLTIAARRDQFVFPYDSALLDGHATLLLEDEGHVSSLFSEQVASAVRSVIRRAAAAAA